MKIEIVNKRNVSVPDKLSNVIEKKVNRLDKYFEDETPIKVTLKGEGSKCKLEMQMHISGAFLGAEAVADNMYDAIDIALPKIEKQIVRYRARFDKKVKQNAFDNAYLYSTDYSEKPERIVKRKSFELIPMNVEEAIAQLEISGHDFYVFLDDKENTVKVLYRRFENDYGLIEPKV